MNQQALDKLYIDIADRVSQESKAIRAKVGAVLVQGTNIVAYGMVLQEVWIILVKLKLMGS